jgi:hypothetical protein
MAGLETEPLRRPLCDSEYFIWLLDRASPIPFLCMAEVSGRLTRKGLEEAVRRVQARHPILRSRIATSEGGIRFEPVPGETPAIRVAERKLAGWRIRLQAQLDRGFPVGSFPLVRCLWFHDGTGESVVALVFHHAVADGIGGATFLTEVLEAADGSGAGGPREPHAPHDGVEALFPPEFRGGAAAWKRALFHLATLADWFRKGPPAKVPNFRVVRFRPRIPRMIPLAFDEKTTASLVAACRRESTSVQGAVGAAGLAAARSEFPGRGPVPLSVWTPVSLRNRVVPPVDPSQLGVFFGNVPAVVRVKQAADFWKTAREYRTVLANRIEAGFTEMSWVSVPPRALMPPTPFGARTADRLLGVFPPSVMVTNIGRLPEGPLPKRVRIRSLSFAVSPPTRDPVALCASSWGGRLFVNVTFSAAALPAVQGARIAERVRAELECAAGAR